MSTVTINAPNNTHQYADINCKINPIDAVRVFVVKSAFRYRSRTGRSALSVRVHRR